MQHRSSNSAAAALTLALALAAPRPALAAWPHDPVTNVRVAPTASPEIETSMCPDGAGGAFIVWSDSRGGGLRDIYAQHITATGAVAGGWPASGLAICTATDDQELPVAVSDGAGGAIIAWIDRRSGFFQIYATRVTGAGTFPGGWPANGRQLLVASRDEVHPAITTDGAGGALVAFDYIFTPGTDSDVYGARVDPSGTVLWAHALYDPLSNQDSPAIVPDGVGGAIGAFEDDFSGNYDIKAVRYNSGGVTVWGLPSSPQVTVSAAAGTQRLPVMAPDGAGGATIAWTDNRGANADIYAMRITAGGAGAVGWGVGGSPVCVAAFSQGDPKIISDGGAGSILAWSDPRNVNIFDVYAQHMGPGGAPSFGWPVDGIPISTAPSQQYIPALVPDGAGGAIIAWRDLRLDVGDVFAARVTAQGLLAPGWLVNGTPICTAPEVQSAPAMIPDGAGGAIMAWDDFRLALLNTHAQNVDHFGQLGDARPAITSIKDAASDQGGHVRLVWNASYLDADPVYGIGAYWIWRQTPASVAQAAVARGGAWLDDANASAPARAPAGQMLFRRADPAAGGYAWEFVAAQSTNGSTQYSYVAPTASDSVAGHNPFTVFMVEARHVGDGAFWDSAPDSGYSVDNVGPAMPAPFTGVYATGTKHLHWGANHEPDLAVYRLYRGGSPDFVPGLGSFVAEKPDTGYDDVTADGSWYKLAAVDVHGNVSPYALLAPTGPVGVDDSRPLTLWLASPAPNPVRDGAVFHFVLPDAGKVSLSLFDVAGRRVRELVHAERPSGEHVVPWDGRDASGRAVAGGLYLIQLDAEGRTLTRRFVVTR